MADNRSQTLEWQRWVLNSVDAMSTCMTEVKATGREAKITGGVDPEGNSVWLLEISGEHRMTPVLANMGMVVVLLGPWLLAVSTDDYMEIFKDDIG